jgi:predicted permease
MYVDGLSVKGSADNVEASLRIVSPQFFETMGIHLQAGRDFSASDDAESPRVAVVNETIARRYFAGGNAVGQRIDVGGDPNTEIIGVIADTKYSDLRAAVPYTVYLAMPQARFLGTERTLHVRTSVERDAAISAVRNQIRALDATMPARIRPFADIVDATLERERLIATLAGVFAALALVLTAAGLFGAIAYSVERRTREIGIRVSVGAQPLGVVWMVLRDCLFVAVAGIALGAPITLWLSGAVKSQLFGVSPHDPATIAIAAGGLLAVAMLAGYLPARRAARVDPVIALRHE